MDVSLLSAMISELITGHDQVGLPGLGTFVAEVVPATFSDKGYTINPPYRRLSFHPGSSEDRLLIDLYAASNGISKEAAGVYVRQFLSEMKSALKERKAIVLPGLGRLRATVENNFFFVADPDLDIYPNGFALKPLSLKAMTDSESDAVPAPSSSVASQPQEASQPEVEVEAETVPGPEAEVAPKSGPAVETEAETRAEAAVEPVIEAAATVETEAQPEPTTEAKPEPELESEPQPESEAEHQAKPETQPESEPESEPQPADQPGRSRFRWWMPLLILLALAAVALLAFLTVAQVAPDLMDSILYTPEELRIINY